MGWCTNFKHYKKKGWIEFISGRWYISNRDYLMEIKLCPWCGATLTTEDI